MTNSPTPRLDASVVGGQLRGGLAMLLVGSFVAVTQTLAGYPALTGQALRYAVATLVLLAVRPMLGAGLVRPTRRELGRLALVAAVGMAGFNLFLLAATRYATPSVVGSVVGAAPVVLALSGAPSGRTRLDRRLVLGALLVCLGVIVSHGVGDGLTVGPGLALSVGAMACEVAFTLLAAPLLPRLGAVNVSTYGCGLAVPLLAAAAAVSPGRDLVVPNQTQLIGLLSSAAVMTALAFCLWYSAVARLGPARSGLLTGLVPTGALIGNFAVTGALPAPLVALGALLSSVGIAAAMSPHRPHADHVRNTRVINTNQRNTNLIKELS